MGRYTKIPQNAFDGLQVDAGILLKNFNIQAAAAGQLGFTDSDIVCATTGGIKPSCVPTYSDYASDVDNAPNNVMEFKRLDGWDCKMAMTGLGTSPEAIRLALGAADVDDSKVTPRRDLKQSDFKSLWWVGDRADGGLVAIKLMNALSTGGFSLQTTKNGKGQISIELTGHVSINAQDVVPMEFYSIDPAEGITYSVSQTLVHVTSTNEDTYAEAEDAYTTTLAAASDYTMENVTVLMNGEDVTDSAYTSGTGVVSIASVTGNIVIVATATAGA